MVKKEDIEKKVSSIYSSLSAKHRKVADFALENIYKIPLMTVQDISEATNVSVASVVRFAKAIGYESFNEFRDEIASSLQRKIEDKSIFKLIDENKLQEDVLYSVAKLEVKNINETLTQINKKEFEQFCSIILQSRKVFSLGLGISHYLSQIFSYQLKQIGIESEPIYGEALEPIEILSLCKKNDCLAAFSFPPYSKGTILAAKFAKERLKIKTLSITNKINAPIGKYSDISLRVKSENMLFTNSLSSILTLINSIVTECALINKSKSEKILRKLNAVAKISKHLLLDQE